MKIHTTRDYKLKTISYPDENQKDPQQFTYLPPGGSYQYRQEKSPSLAYIDRKYDEYMRGNYLNKPAYETTRQ